jgi:hypothetical protein
VTEPDHIKPLLLGYIREHFLMTAAELAQTKAQLVTFARAEGFTLHAIYVERIETAPAAFGALVEAVQRYHATAVVLPNLHHMTMLGAPTSIKGHFEHLTGARVLVADPPP